MGYTNAALITAQLKRELTDSENSLLGLIIPAVSSYIDLKLGTSFSQVEASTRYYTGGDCLVDIDPCTDPTAVNLIDDYGTASDTYDASNYIFEPANATVKTYIRKRWGKFPKGLNRIGVTAKFSQYGPDAEGNAVIPHDIQLAATIIAAGLLSNGPVDADGNGIKSENIEGHSISYVTSVDNISTIATNNPTVKSILDLRREIYCG